MKLEQLQKTMQSAILTQNPENLFQSKAFLKYPERLRAHVEAYSSFTSSYICNMFPYLHKLLKEDFEVITEEFCKESPPTHYDLGILLEDFVKFFCAHKHVCAYPFLIDLCCFESLENKIYHEAAPEILSLEDFVCEMSQNPKTTVLKLQDHVYLLSLAYDLEAYFDSQEDIKDLEELEKYKKKTDLVMYQSHWRALYWTLESLEKDFLSLLPSTFQDLCEKFEKSSEKSQDLSPVLMKMIHKNILIF